MIRPKPMKIQRGSLYQRVFLLNAAILIVATLVVAITPATVSFPVELTEAIVLVAGLIAILVLNAVALRAAFAPLERLRRSMREVDPYRPGKRLEATGPQEVRELVDVFNDMLDRLEGERRESGRQALAAQEGERWRVAQELHDDVGQALTGILLRLEALARQAPAELRPDVRATQEAARETIDRVSRVARQLRPEALGDLGLAKALAAAGRGGVWATDQTTGRSRPRRPRRRVRARHLPRRPGEPHQRCPACTRYSGRAETRAK